MGQAKLLFSADVYARPVVLKNSKKICRGKGGRTFVKSNDRVTAWMDAAVAIYRAAHAGKEPIKEKVQLKCTFWLAVQEDSGNLPDQSNLYQAPEDSLQRAGVIEDDRQVESHDGSRRIRMCPICQDRPKYKAGPKKGQYKPNCGKVKMCPYEGVRVEIFSFED